MNSSRRTMIGLVAVLCCAAEAVAQKTVGERSRLRSYLASERPDDPPGVAALVALPSGPPMALPLRGIELGPIQVNVDALGRNIPGDAANEPSIAVDPTDPRRMAIGWRQFDTISSNFREAGWAFSRDSGQSWTFPGVIQNGTFRSEAHAHLPDRSSTVPELDLPRRAP